MDNDEKLREEVIRALRQFKELCDEQTALIIRGKAIMDQLRVLYGCTLESDHAEPHERKH